MPSPLASALRNPRFLKLLAGQCISAIGDRFTELALLSLALGGQASAELARLDFWSYLPWILLGPFAGLLVDRYSRRKLMIAADLGRLGLVLTLFAFGLRDGQDLGGTYPVLFAMGMLSTVFSPAKSACLPDLVPVEQVMPAGALLAAVGVASTALGSTLAGKVIDTWGWRACLGVDALSFGLSAAFIWSISFPVVAAAPRVASSFAGTLKDLAAGLREMRRNPELRPICAFLFVFWFVANSVKVLAPNFAKEALALQTGQPGGMTSVGHTMTLAGLGLLAGAALTALAGHRIARRAAYFLASAGMGGGLLGLTSSHAWGPALFWLFITGLAGGTLVSRVDADILKVVAPGMRGRIFGAVSVLFAGALLSPLRPIGWLSQRATAASILQVLAWILLGLAVLVLLRLLRDLKAGRPLILPLGEARPQALPDTAAYPLIRLLGHLIFKPLYRLRSHGEEQVPAEGPVILAANHSSYWDPVFLQLSLPDRQVRWLMDEDYYNLPVLRWFFRAVGCIPVKNSGGNRRALDAAVQVLKAGGVLGIFPEGHISRTGRMDQAHTGVSLLSARTGAPVMPAYLRGAMFSWPKGQKLPRLSRVEVRFAEPMRLPEGEGAEKAALRAFADRLMAQIKGLYGRGSARVGPRGEGEA